MESVLWRVSNRLTLRRFDCNRVSGHYAVSERDRAVGRLGDKFAGFDSFDKRIAAYHDEPVEDWQAHDLVIRAVDCRAITTSQVPDVVREWREPTHSEFRARNLWSLFNAFTEVYKTQNPATTVRRSEALHGLCDGVVGLS